MIPQDVFHRKLWLSILAWAIIGVGTSFALTPSYADMDEIAK